MKLLVSPRNPDEAAQALNGGADIIDVKNPLEGSLGANYPWVIREVKNSLDGRSLLSATIGDLDDRVGFASQKAYGLSLLGPDYIKAGLKVRKRSTALKLANAISRAVEDTSSKVILAAYADYREKNTLSPLDLPQIAKESRADGIMIDTLQKDGRDLFDHLTEEELKAFITEGREQGLITALAGNVQHQHIPTLKKLNPHIIGVRGAVCTKKDRNQGTIQSQKVKEFKEQIKTTQKGRVV